MDYIEAVNNVKLFSFMLLIISSIELLNLMAIAMGNGQALQQQETMDPWEVDHDDFFDDDDANNSTSATNFTNAGGDASLDPAVAIYETWQPLSYMDVVVSVLGVYVALLGIKASNENTLQLARLYWMGTCVVAVGWLVYNYIISLEVDEAIEEEMEQDGEGSHSNSDYADTYHTSDQSVYNQAFQVMVLPAMVWCLCIFRAWQFQSLIAEAEQEAADRIAAEVDAANGTTTAVVATVDTRDDDDEELALQNPGALLT